jgi:hypothetical protein
LASERIPSFVERGAPIIVGSFVCSLTGMRRGVDMLTILGRGCCSWVLRHRISPRTTA